MRVWRLAWLPLLVAAAPSWGQANLSIEECPDGVYEKARTDGSIVICRITVIGNLPSSRSEQTESIDRIYQSGTSERIEQRLSIIPGLQQFRRSDARSANPTSQGVTLRGLGGNASSRALLFLDDVPQADPFGGWVSWPSYDSLNLASIRVRKGGGQASVGPGALAGVIELDSLQARDKAGGSLSYGSRNSIEARGYFLDDLNDGSISASASYSRGDGFVPIIATQRGAADSAARYEQGSASLRMEGYLNDRLQLQGNMRAFTDNRDRGIAFSDNRNGGVDASLRLVKRTGDWRWSATGYVQLREFSSQFGAVSADRSTVTPTLDQFSTPSTGLGLRFEIRPPVGDKAELRLGGEWRRTDGVTKEKFTFVAGVPTRLRTAGGQTDSYGGFAEFSVEPIEDIVLSAGGRLDQWQIDDGFRREVNIGGNVRSDDRFAHRSGTEWTGRVGFGWDGGNGLSFKGSAYRGWRLPTLNELYRPFRVGADATAANENLNPERITGAEATFAFYTGDLDGKVTAFYNRLDNAIANVTLGQGPGTFPGVGFVAAGGAYRQRQNLDAIVSKGIEIDAGISVTDDLELRFGYAYVDAEVRASGASAPLNGLRPAQVPRHFATASFNYGRGGDFSVDGKLRYLGSQFEDDANSRILDDALTADLSLGYALTEKLHAELRAENLFDAHVEAAISSAGVIERSSPRTIWFGLRYDLE
jgi:vitamin B12 transporter